jgi:UDP-glucose 4-epimerase
MVNKKTPVSLVTGGAGFIGSHVADALIDLGHRVVILDDLSGGFKENVNKQADFVQGSITDVTLINKIFSKYSFDYVYHLAAYAAEGLSHFIRRFNYSNNLIGSINLLNASINTGSVKCFVFTSSIAVYGSNQTPMKEKMIPQPEDPYGVAKYAFELDLKAAHKMFGTNYIIFRPHNVYGPRQNIADRYRNVIGIFMNQALKNEDLTIFGNGKQTRAFSYIDDVAPLIAQSVSQKKAYNNIFNVGSDTPISVNKIAELVNKVLHTSSKIKHLESRNEVIDAFSDHQKIKTYFQLSSPTPTEIGLAKMSSWVKEKGPQKTTKFSNIEVTKNLPKSWRS